MSPQNGQEQEQQNEYQCGPVLNFLVLLVVPDKKNRIRSQVITVKLPVCQDQLWIVAILLDVCRSSVPQRPQSSRISRPSPEQPPISSTNVQTFFFLSVSTLPDDVRDALQISYRVPLFTVHKTFTSTNSFHVSVKISETSLRNVAPKLPANKPRPQSQVRPRD